MGSTRLKLVPHPDCSLTPLSAIQVSASRADGRYLRFGFRAVGETDQIAWPGENSSGHEGWERADDLWRHSCFEVFGKIPGQPGYFEINMTTSGKWAAYGFYDYRAGMRRADDIEIIMAHWTIRPQRAELHAMLEIPSAFAEYDWQVGFSAVIEETDGTKSYWALAHPPGKPDFHHPDCFTLELPPPSAP